LQGGHRVELDERNAESRATENRARIKRPAPRSE
jgi:hypothetical protein